MSPLSRRLGALVAASTLTVTGLTLGAAPAQAATDPRPLEQGASWLTSQLTGGLVHNPNFGGFDDFGLSIDIALALDEIGGAANDRTVSTIGTAIRNNYYSYTTGADYGGPEIYAGGQGKALVLAQVAGTGPTTYQSGVQSNLEDRVSEAGALTGRIENFGETDFQAPFGPIDTANVFGQAYATRALVTAESDRADDALTFLLDQQCADGAFREQFDAKDDPDQGCDPADTATYGDRIGATSTVVLNLDPFAAEPEIAPVLTAARAWLKDQQDDEGFFGTTGNANTTGIAARAIGASPEATEAASWLRAHQLDDTDACTKAGAANTGAIAFDDAGLADARANGVPTTDVSNGKQDQLRRASAQAVPALAYLEAEPTQSLDLTGPTGFVQASKAATYTVTGAAASSKLCLTVAANYRATTAAPAGSATAALTLPSGTANRTVTVTDRNGNTDTVLTRVLGVKTLAVKPAVKRVKKGAAVWVTVSGLVAGESVTLRYKRVVVAAGTANSAGKFVRKISVGRRLGVAGISATGQFPTTRKGATTIRVVR